MNLLGKLENQLKKEPDFVTDNGELKKWVVIHKAQNFDIDLIKLLLDNGELKEKFFIEVKGALIFNQNLFVQFMEQKNYLNDSYTNYKNKVGLTIDGKYLKQRNEVALAWPFKDCILEGILEGGQSREEDKREEIFCLRNFNAFLFFNNRIFTHCDTNILTILVNIVLQIIENFISSVVYYRHYFINALNPYDLAGGNVVLDGDG